jgi:hypothetical protein
MILFMLFTGCGGGGDVGSVPSVTTSPPDNPTPTPDKTITPVSTPVTPPSSVTPGTTDGQYDMGNPVLTDIWVDPQNGNDENSGNSRLTALRTLIAAWELIPKTPLNTTGYRIQLITGTFTESQIPLYWENRYGTYKCPVIIQAVDGHGTVNLPSLNIANCSYLYFIGLNIQGGNTFHIEGCNHILIRNCKLSGMHQTQETIKANQSQYFYVENSDISGAENVSLDCVAVQYGHITGNKIYDAVDWCIYLKGGSSYFVIERNEIYNGGTGGFTAGQGSGFEYMVSPWLHYEVYDIKFINNIIHDTDGAGIGVNGGYNILMAYNTIYRVGKRSHSIEVVHGARSCDGNVSACQERLSQGGWGTATAGDGSQMIPDRNIYIYNNIVYNPPGYQSGFSHFSIHGPVIPPAESNVPSPSNTDDNLQIRGNIIWNGGSDMALGAGGEGEGGQATNQTCNPEQLLRENSINTLQPQLGNDMKPVSGGNVYSAEIYQIPDFTWNDAPVKPSVPAGNLSNIVTKNYEGEIRNSPYHPGAY